MAKRFTRLMAALALLIFMAPSMVTWGQTRTEVVAYTLQPASGSNNSYTGNCDITIDGITWNLTGNSQQIPWRIGGKNLTNVDRPLYSKTAISDNISKIEVTHGSANNITVNSWTVIVASDVSFDNVVSTLTPDFEAEETTTINRPDGVDWTNCYYKFVYNVSVSGNTNRFIQFTQAAFYKEEGSVSAPSITAENVEIEYDDEEGEIEYTISNPVEGGVLTANTDAEWLTIGTVGETVPFTSTVNDDGEREATITLTYTYNTDQTVTKNVTVTQANNPNAPGTENNPYTVAQARAAIDAGTGTQGVYATGIVSAIPTAYNPTYSNVTFNMVDEEGDEVFLQAYRCGGEEAANVAIGDVVVVYGNLTKYGSTYEFGSGCQVVSLEHPVITEPSITVTPATVPAPVGGSDGVLNVTYENITTVAAEIAWYEATGAPLQDGYDWIDAEIDADNNVYYVINANNGEARTAYLKVWAYDDDLNEVYSNLVTIDQDEYVAPTYAELPFAFNGGRDDIETTDGLYQEDLGTDYNASTNPNTQLKFDGTGDWLLLQFSERPGTLTFDIKGNGFSGSTFTVQTSEDGTTYTDKKVYTELSGTIYDTIADLDAEVRYIKWIYTNKSSGNVGLGNITLAEYVEPVIVASITVTPDVVNVNAEEHDGTLTLAYENLTITEMSDFDIQYYNAEGQEAETPDWIEVLVAEQDPQIGEGYVVSYYMLENEGEARTAYFKVYAMDDETNLVHSNLVTINQEAYVAPVPSITITPDNFELDANSHMAEVLTTITYQDILVVPGSGVSTFEVHYYDAEDHEIEHTWCTVGAVAQGDTGFDLAVFAFANEGNEARTAYFKLSAHDADSNLVYSNLVTVTQAAFVIDYATLPFVWEGGSSTDFAALNGVTLSGNGSDYNSNHAPYLIKLDGTGDYIQVKTDSQPGTVTIGVKMIGGSNTSTITIQGSADGETFTDIEVLTISGAQNDTLTLETTNAFADADRYVRMLFTKGSNVGVGPITIEKGNASSITVTPATLDLEAVGTMTGGSQMQQLSVTYHNLDIESYNDFTVQFYDAQGEEQTQPDWIFNSVYVSGGGDLGYMVLLMISENDGPARSAYFKVYASDAESNVVYSNLVTINQAAAVVPPTPGTWVLTDLADLTADDIFVIVGTYEDPEHDSYALPHNGGTSNSPSAVAVTIVDNTLSEEPAAELQWNLEVTEDGYIFYPNDTTETWLYCTNSNTGVRVGTNENNIFTISEEGYLYNNATLRYLGIFNTQDWRCYTSINNNIAGQSFAFYKKVESPTTETQTIALATGINWVSFYVDINLDALKAALVEAMPVNGVAIAAQNGGRTTYNGGRWRGALNSLDLSQMYKITVPESCEITVEGMPIDPAMVTVTIRGGLNWIAFPFMESMTITDAFAGFATNGDQVKSMNDGQTAYNGTRWRGALNTLVPGKGYIYNSASTEVRPFVFPSPSKVSNRDNK